MASKKTVSLWKLVASGSWLAGQEFPLYEEGTVLGRGKTCDITIPGTHLSRSHAELIIRDGKLMLRDLDSANGTFLNNERISEAQVNAGDTLRVDVYTFRVEGPKGSQGQASAADGAVKGSVDLTASQSLENIRNLKKTEKDYTETQWVTKPTSVGNRTHNVPGHKGADVGFWLAVIIGLAAVGGLVYYFLI